MQKFIHRVKALVLELGFFNALAYKINQAVFAKFRHYVFFHYKIVVQPVAPKPFLPARLGRSISVEQMRQMHAELAYLPVPEQVVQQRFAQQAICFLAKKSESVVGCIWVCENGYDEDEVRSRFIPHPSGQSVWDFDVYIAPEARSGIAFVRLWDEVNQYLRGRGVRYTVSRISAFNMQSSTSHARMGAKILGSIVYIRVFRLQLMLGQFAPWIHLSWANTQVPSVRIDTRKYTQI